MVLAFTAHHSDWVFVPPRTGKEIKIRRKGVEIQISRKNTLSLNNPLFRSVRYRHVRKKTLHSLHLCAFTSGFTATEAVCSKPVAKQSLLK